MTPELAKQQHKKRKQKERKKIFRKWHRRLGFTASLFLFNLAITGIMLNHYELFSLHKKHISSPILLDWYNVKAPQNISCSGNSDTSVCQLGKALYLNNASYKNKRLVDNSNRLISLISTSQENFVITSELINIYNQEYQLIDSIDASETFLSSISKANLIDNTLVVKAGESEFFFEQDSFEFAPVSPQQKPYTSPLVSSIFQLKDKALIESLGQVYRQNQITLLKFVQDLHSGQILSIEGKIITDITGVIIMLLAISGFITWQRRKNKEQK